MQDIIIYYLIKRLFLFCDEWLFYTFLYLLLIRQNYKIIILISSYGLSCIYTSYYNIDLIEKNILDVNQKIFLYHGSVFDLLFNHTNTIHI